MATPIVPELGGNALLDYAPLLLSERWTYRGEGNANIVLAGDFSHPQVIARFGSPYLTMRLRKITAPSPAASSHSLATTDGAADDKDTALSMILFIHNAISPLFSKQHIPAIGLVRVTSSFMQALSSSSTMQRRHPSRLHKLIDTTQQYVAVLRDYSRLPFPPPALCLELKPKWLFVPEVYASLGSDRSACRYCLHQFFKEQNKVSFKRSTFCPLDLVSGESGAVDRAVTSLMACPQNNLRVWVDGDAIDLSRVKAGDIDTQKRSELSWLTTSQPDGLRNIITNAIHALHPLLKDLSQHQQRLDHCDIEHIYALYRNDAFRVRLHNAMNANGAVWTNVLSRYLGTQKCNGLSTDIQHKDIDESDQIKNNIDDDIQTFLEFLLSATLKDCSVMITLTRQDAESVPHNYHHRYGEILAPLIEANGVQYCYQAVLLDLDPKLPHKLPKWHTLHKNILQAFTNVLARQTVVQSV